MSEKKILLVEDEVLIAIAKQRQLQNYGYLVDHVDSGEEAIRYTLQADVDVDLILMDINLGEMLGTEAAKIILSFKEIPIVFFSSHSEPEVVRQTEHITSYGYVLKDSSIVVLDASIKMALKLFEANKNLRRSEKFRKKIFDTSKIPFVILETENFTCIDCNNAALQVYGLEDKPEILGKTLLDFSSPTQYDGTNSAEKVKSILDLALSDGSVFFEWRNQKPNGMFWDSEIQMLSLKAEGKIMLQYSVLDTTRRRSLDVEFVRSKERVSKQREAIAQLVSDSTVFGDNLSNALHKVNEYITSTLNVQRSSIWVLNETTMELKTLSTYDSCTKLYERETARKIDFTEDFVSLINENRLYCVDILNDPRTKNLARFYKLFGIGALLGVGFFVDGKLKGVICSEHIGEKRDWYPDEESFSSTVAAIVGQLFVREEMKFGVEN